MDLLITDVKRAVVLENTVPNKLMLVFELDL